MKRFILIAVLAVVAAGASAGVKFGLKGGLNVSDMSVSKDVVDGSNRTGFFVGPTLKVSLPLVGWGFDISALYEQRSAQLKSNSYSAGYADFETDVTRKYINVPINVRYDIGLSSLASLFFAVGPQFGFNVGHSSELLDADSYSEWELKKSNLSANVGLGIVFLKHCQISANYNIGLGKTGEVTLRNAAQEVVTKSSHDNTWQVALTYYF